MFSPCFAGFIVGILLAKSGIFLYPQKASLDALAGIILLLVVVVWFSFRKANGGLGFTVFFSLAALLWGNVHASPSFAGPCSTFTLAKRNPLQFSRGPAVIVVADKRYESVVRSDYDHVGGRIVGSDLVGPKVLSVNCDGIHRAVKAELVQQSILRWYVSMGGSDRMVGWINASVFGSRKGLSHRYVNAFKKTGLLHLLVVSGLHVGLFAGFVLWFLRLPFQLLYAATVINPGQWKSILIVTEVVTALLVAGYVLFIGAPQAAQRAGAFFVVWIVGKNFLGVKRSAARFQLCMLIQAVLFPVGFLTSGNILSWVATLFLVERSQTTSQRVSEMRLVMDWRLQLKIMCLCCVLFSEVSLISMPANLLLAPAFAAMLYITNFNLIFPVFFLSRFVNAVIESYLLIVLKIGHLVSEFGYFYMRSESLHPLVRILLLVLAGTIVLNSLRNLSIRPVDQ